MGLQYGIKEVLNVGMYDFATNKPILFADYATVSTNEVNGERLFLSGGQGNYRLMSFDHSKTTTLKMTLPMVDLKMLALLAGDDLVTGVAQNVYKREVFTIADGTVTLSETPIADSQVVYALSGLRDNGTEYIKVTSAPTGQQYSISNKTLTFDAAENGKQVVVWYQYATPTTAQKIGIKANKFAKAVKIFGDGLWRDQETETDKAVKVTVHKAKAQSNFTLTMSSDKATELEVTFDVFAVKDANGDYAYIDYVVL